MFRVGVASAISLLMLSALAFARDGVPTSASDLLDEGLGLAGAMKSQKRGTECTVGPDGRTGLTTDAGRVVAADILAEIGGFAKDAGVSGGLGGQLRIVTSEEDYDPRRGEKPIPGSLRAAVTAGPAGPRWIVFALKPGAVITLKDTLRLPDNITLDGGCADITLEAAPKVGIVYIFGRRNVIVSRLGFRKTRYEMAKSDDAIESCIRLNGFFDAVAIVHNDLSRCGDGAIDVTTSPGKPVPNLARATISYNRITEHDKVMLFGTFTCGPTGRDDEPCGSVELEHNRTAGARLYLTLSGNLFLRTAQRHPRVFGRVMAHIVNNVIAFQQYRLADGRVTDVYGTFVSNGARALIENNVYLMTGAEKGTPSRAVWTTTTAGAQRMPWDVEGFMRIRQNKSVGSAIIAENEPQLVPDPGYQEVLNTIPLEGLPLAKAIACIAARAGKEGEAAWPHPCY